MAKMLRKDGVASLDAAGPPKGAKPVQEEDSDPEPEMTLAKSGALEENLRRCARTSPFINPGLGPEWETWKEPA